MQNGKFYSKKEEKNFFKNRKKSLTNTCVSNIVWTVDISTLIDWVLTENFQSGFTRPAEADARKERLDGTGWEKRKDFELFGVTYEDGEYKVTMIEKGVGPANLCVVNEKDRDIIVAANHTANEAAVYFVTE